MCFYQLYLYFFWRLIFCCHTSSGLFVPFFHLCMNSLFKKEKKIIVIWCLCVVPLIVLFRYADLVFPGFFWHCTFNLKKFPLFIGYQCSPFFLTGLYKFAIFVFFIFYGDRLLCKNWNVGVVCPREWRLRFLWCSRLLPFSPDIY